MVNVATTAYPWTKTNYTPTFTGIPPHVVQPTELRELKLKINCLKADVLTEIVGEMEKRGFASSECNTNNITDANAFGAMIEKMTATGAHAKTKEVEEGRWDCTPFVTEEDDIEIHDQNEKMQSEEEKQLNKKDARTSYLLDEKEEANNGMSPWCFDTLTSRLGIP